MSIEVGYPDRLLDAIIIDKYYKDYTIFTKDFFKNLQVSIIKFIFIFYSDVTVDL